MTGAAIVGATWVATTAIGPGSFRLEGSITLSDGTDSDGIGCWGTGGYSDISEGASVTVYGATGSVLATGVLTSGTPSDPGCVMNLVVDDVPGGESFYQVEVSHRGKVTYPEEDAREGRVSLNLGD